MRDDDDKIVDKGEGLSRRNFLKVSGISLAVPLVVGPKVIKAAGAEVKVFGPGKAPISLMINGKKYATEVEPRVTLLEALRNELDITGAKRVCDRATCGACTVIIDGKPVYSCTMLAIEAQGKTDHNRRRLDARRQILIPFNRRSVTTTRSSAASARRVLSLPAKHFSTKIQTQRQNR